LLCYRWYYNEEDDICEEFSWGGCGGNANNFLTKKHCLAKCGANLTGLKGIEIMIFTSLLLLQTLLRQKSKGTKMYLYKNLCKKLYFLP
jgi:Kunitz/Bovine pancreatic trypsin inhibitor domain